jgi:hypothetical protein
LAGANLYINEPFCGSLKVESVRKALGSDAVVLDARRTLILAQRLAGVNSPSSYALFALGAAYQANNQLDDARAAYARADADAHGELKDRITTRLADMDIDHTNNVCIISSDTFTRG